MMSDTQTHQKKVCLAGPFECCEMVCVQNKVDSNLEQPSWHLLLGGKEDFVAPAHDTLKSK